MSAEPEVLDCQLVTLPAPIRVATPKFAASLKDAEGEVARLKITDVRTMQAAADLQARLTKGGTWLEEARQKVKEPFLAQARIIDATAKIYADRIETAKRTLKAGLLAYNTAQIAIANAIEAKKRAELARLEGIRQAEEAKAAEVAKVEAERVAKLPVPTLKLEDDAPPEKTETEKEIERVAAAPAVVVAKPSGLSWRVTLVATVTDIKALPEIFVIRTANMQAIRSTFATGWKDGMPIPECAGVKFEAKREAVTR